MTRGHALVLVHVLVLVLVAGCPAPPRHPAPPPPPLPAPAYAHYLRGRIAGFEGDAERATRELAGAVAAAPDEPELRVAYVEALLEVGRRADARAVVELALERWPASAAVQRTAGRVYRELRDYRRAAAALERARHIDPDDERSALDLGATYLAMERLEDAAAVYRDLARRRPEAVAPRLRLARLLVAARRYAAAERPLAEVLAIDPDDVEARVLEARVQGRLGRPGAALAGLRQALARSGRDPEVAEELFVALLEAGDPAAALAVLGELEAGDLDADERVELGFLYLRAGRFRRALALARGAKDGAGSGRLAAFSLAALRRFAAAAEAARAAAEEDPAWSLRYAAEMLARAGRRDRALALVDAAEPGPDRAVARSRVHEIAGDVEQARRVLAGARRRWPDEVELGYAAALLELRAGRPREALRLAEPLLARRPTSWRLSNFVGYVLADAGLQLERARRLLERVARGRPDDPTVLDSLGWLALRREDSGAAAKLLYRAARLAPTDPEILYHVGVLEQKLGRLPAARRRLERARRLAVERWLLRRIEAAMASL